MLIINIILLVVVSYIVYWCLDNYGFKKAWLVEIVYAIVVTLMRGQGFTFGSVIGILLVTFIKTAVATYIYNKVNSFKKYLLFLVLTYVVIIGGLSLIITIITMSTGANRILR